MKKYFFLLQILFAVHMSYGQYDLSYKLPDNVSEKELIASIIGAGDTIAYHHLYNYYMNHREVGNILSYSLIMANKWNYSIAMYDVYIELLSLYNCLFSGNLEIMDLKTRRFALEYLMLYYENAPECKERASAYRNEIIKYVEKGYLIILNDKIVINEDLFD